MWTRLTLSIAIVILLLPWHAAAQSRIFVGDPTFTMPESNPLTTQGHTIADTVATGLQNGGHCTGVVSANDVRDLARFERMRQLLGATDDAAVAGAAEELAGALGADRFVTVSVGALGSRYIINTAAIGPKGVIARVTETGTGAREAFAAAERAGAKLGQAMGCGRPATPLFFEGTLTYELTWQKSDSTTDSVGGTSSLETRAHRRDDIEVRGMRDPIGQADFDEVSKSRVTTPETLSQCPAPGGYRDLPSKVDMRTEMNTKGGGRTKPSVELAVDGKELRIEVFASEYLPRVMTQTDSSTGLTCGKAFGPDTTSSTSEAVSTSVDSVNVDVRVPFDPLQTVQTGSKSWPVEVNGMRGTATITWKLTGRL